MAASISDVARLAGVSIATVSRSLRGLPNVSTGTRERVQRAAAELSYTASPTASSLASGRTRTVGVVVPYVTRWFFSQVVAGTEAVLRDNGFDLLLYNLGGEAGRLRFFDRLPLRRRVDAVIVIALPLQGEEIAQLRGLDVPVALVGSTVPGFAGVRIDDVEGATKAVRHLLALGHERVALISARADERMHFTAPVDRRVGYQAALTAAGLPVDPALDVTGHWGLTEGAQAMADLLALPDPPTGVFAESDEMALGALRTARRCGLRVPRDVSVVGFDDHEMSDLLDLTTVAQPVREQGVLAATLLLDAIDRRDDDDPPQMTLPTRLVVRASTGPPPDRAAGSPSRPAHAGLWAPSAPVAPG